MRRLFVMSLLPLTLSIVAAWCNISIPSVIKVVETVEVIKEVEVIRERVVVNESEAATAAVVIKEVEVVKEVESSTVIEEKPKEKIIFHNGGWESLNILNAIAMYVIEYGYGYPVEQKSISEDTMMAYLPIGDIHVNMELWRFSKQDWYDSNLSSSRIIDVGAIYESSTQGLYVPRYTIEGDSIRGIEATAPDLKSVTDLPKYWNLFADSTDPSKGVLVSCLVDWQCYKIMRVKTTGYGLDEYFNLLTPQTEAGRDTVITDLYTQGKPLLIYHWEPTWVLGKYDMVQLEEPEYTDECWEELELAISQDPLGIVTQTCAFPSNDIHTAVYGGLLDRAPEVVAFLKNMFVGTARINELTSYMVDNSVEPEAVAIYYLKTYESEWQRWVPNDVAEKVKASLQ